MILRVITALLFIQGSRAACKTPNGENGDCKIISSCPSLQQRLNRRPIATSDIHFLQNSTCGFEGSSPKVCCPFQITTTNDSNTTSLITDPLVVEAITNKLLPGTDICGFYNPYRTFGREHPDIYEFPWMALMEYKDERTERTRNTFLCGGVLISSRYVLTAANCVKVAEKRKYKLLRVRLGEYNLDTDQDCVNYGFGEECAQPHKDIDVESTIVHENFSLSKPNSDHDIALIRLKEEVEFTDFIQPICLPMTTQELSKNYVGKKLFVAGWSRAGHSPKSQIKLKDQIQVRKPSVCSEILPVTLTENQLCAGGDAGQMWCKGDGGGPLMAIGTDINRKITRWYAIGVSSSGLANSCSSEIYTKVSSYMTWIVKQLKP